MIDSSSSGAAVTGTLDASHDAHNRGVADVEAPGDTAVRLSPSKCRLRTTSRIWCGFGFGFQPSLTPFLTARTHVLWWRLPLAKPKAIRSRANRTAPKSLRRLVYGWEKGITIVP
jgi:hypothetical protein